MTTPSSIDSMLTVLKDKTVLVVGDFFLDDYLWLDPDLTEISIETGLDAYQVVERQRQPGAAGTVVNNLRALGIGQIRAIGVCGLDGEGFELKRALDARGVDTTGLIEHPSVFTPTYTKPMRRGQGQAAVELNRLDTRNRQPISQELESLVLERLRTAFPKADAVIAADQVGDPHGGVITAAVRDELAALAARYPSVICVADSRARIGLFREILVKPNEHELSALFSVDPPERGGSVVPVEELAAMGQELARRTGRAVFATCGERGILVCTMLGVSLAPGIPVDGPLDIVGAGDSATAGIVAGLLAGIDAAQAASVGNLVASVTVQKLGTTGDCSPVELRKRAEAAADVIPRPIQPEWRRRPLAGPGIEILRSSAVGPMSAAIFDFDGTLSLIRQGWQDVMAPFMVEELLALRTGESAEALTKLVNEFIFRLTGKQTIYQMIQLAEEIRRRGGSPLPPLEYKQEYHRRLWARIEGRVAGLKNGSIEKTSLLVPGSCALLDELVSRGVTLYLASGTDIEYVRDEAEALGLTAYFGTHIYGALSRQEDFSKRMVIERVIREASLKGPELVAFGDGYVEIEDTRRAGGRAVGAATDEASPGQLDLWKRNRLIAAGADVIVADFSHAAELTAWLEQGHPARGAGG